MENFIDTVGIATIIQIISFIVAGGYGYSKIQQRLGNIERWQETHTKQHEVERKEYREDQERLDIRVRSLETGGKK